MGHPYPILVLHLTPLFYPIWMDNPMGIPRGCLGGNRPPTYAEGLETHPVEGHRDVHIFWHHPHHGAPVWVLDAWLPAVGLQGVVEGLP